MFRDPRPGPKELLPGLVLIGAITAAAAVVAALLNGTSQLVWAILLAALLSSGLGRRQMTGPGIEFAAGFILRAGVALLGLQIPLGAITAMGPGLILVSVGTLAATFSLSQWVGRLAGIDRGLATAIAAGTAVCGASAIAAAASTLRIKEEATTYAVGTITLYGSLMMFAIPFAGKKLGLDAETTGIWAGAAIHEVGQVAVAGAAVSTAALHLATLVKLSRVALLAPLLLILQRRIPGREGGARPKVPGFLVAFALAILARTWLPIPGALIEISGELAIWFLAAGLAAFGLRIDLRKALAVGAGPALVGLVAGVIAACSSLALILLFT